MITAKEARELQRIGVPQEEYFRNAMERAQAAVLDIARRGGDSVLVALPFLSRESFDKVVSNLSQNGFLCTDCEWGERTSKVRISWASPDESKKEGSIP